MKKWLEENYKKCLIVLACLIVILIIIFFLLRKPTYLITFDSNGGSVVSSVKVKKGDKIPEPEEPTREGYTFIGWEYEDVLYDFSKPVTKKMTLKAYWTGNTSGIELENTTITLKPEDEESLKITINGDELTLEDLEFISSDESIATIDSNGKITAIKDGKVTITIKSKDGKYSATCEVVVASKVVEVESVSITGNNKVTVGSTIKLTATVKPNDATNKNVTWKSSNTKVATVDKNGNVRGVNAGTVTITATSDNGKESSKTITVEAKKEEPKEETPTTPSNPTPSNPTPSTPTTPSEPEKPKDVAVTGVTLTGGNSVNVGATVNLAVNITPGNATNKNFTCTSSDQTKATVTKSGTNCVVTGKDDGEVTITVKTADGSYTATHTVTIKSTYRVELKRHFNDYDVVVGYYVTVYKNNQPWTDYLSLTIDGKYKKFNNGYALVGSDIPNESEKKLSSIEINLNNGDSVSATVTYNN